MSVFSPLLLNPPFGSGSSSPIAIAAPISGDPEILDDIVDRIRATGAFMAVEWGLPIGELIQAVDMLPCAAVELSDWQEADTFDADTSLKTTRFTVTIACKSHDPREAQAEALRLSSLVANAINRKKLAGVTWIPFTTINQGRVDKRRHPESRLTMTGSYRYEINRSYNHYEELDI